MTDIHAGPDPATRAVAGIVLAGGRSSRMGRNKALLQVQRQSLLERALERLSPQVEVLLVSSNELLPGAEGVPQLSDSIDGFAGPLAGICSGLQWLIDRGPDCDWLLSVAVDTPFFPLDLRCRLQAGCGGDTTIICAASADRLHPTCSLWHTSLLSPLRQYLEIDCQRRMMAFVKQHKFQQVEFPVLDIDPFYNINTPADLALAARL